MAGTTDNNPRRSSGDSLRDGARAERLNRAIVVWIAVITGEGGDQGVQAVHRLRVHAEKPRHQQPPHVPRTGRRDQRAGVGEVVGDDAVTVVLRDGGAEQYGGTEYWPRSIFSPAVLGAAWMVVWSRSAAGVCGAGLAGTTASAKTASTAPCPCSSWRTRCTSRSAR